MNSSSTCSRPIRASMIFFGTLPLRKPGIFTWPATFRYARSRPRSTSSGGTSTVRRTTCLSVSSTVVCIRHRAYWKTAFRQRRSELDVLDAARAQIHVAAGHPGSPAFLRRVPDADLGPTVHLSDGRELGPLELQERAPVREVAASGCPNGVHRQVGPFPRARQFLRREA